MQHPQPGPTYGYDTQQQQQQQQQHLSVGIPVSSGTPPFVAQQYPSGAQPQYNYVPGGPQQQQPGLGQPGQAPFNLGAIDSTIATQIGLQYGQVAFDQGRKIFDQNVNRYLNIPALKYYFSVSNDYVVQKIKLLLFPFLHKSWARIARPEHGTYAPPREDFNAPDMYIPLMAFITFTLLVGLAKGQQNEFEPELLGLMLSKCIGVVLFEVVGIKFSSFLLNLSADVEWFDLIAYCGYKFVGMIVTVIIHLLFGSTPFWLSFAYVSIALALFLLRSLRQNLAVADSISQSPYRRLRNYFLLAIAGSQILSSYFLLMY